MNKMDFLRQLEELLRDIPENERREAIEYYRNYFDDAGPENEAQIIEELGSPWKVAESIKRDLFDESYKAYSFEKPSASRSADRTTRNILIAVLLIFTCPLWIGLAAAAFGLLVAAAACVFALAICVVAIVGVFFIVGVVLTGVGFTKLFTGLPAIGLILLGIGLLMLAFGMLGLIITVWAVGRILPWTIRAIVRICKKPFQKRGALI